MPIGSAIAASIISPIVGSVVGQALGGSTAAQGQQQAAQQQGQGLQNAANALQGGYGNAGNALQTAYNTASGTLQPWSQLGGQSATALSNLLGSGYLTNQFNNQDLNAQLAPNYAFMLGQGQQATNAANNAAGGFLGGNALQGLNTFTQNYASNAYQNAFNNYQSQRQNIFGDLSTLGQLGQSGTNALANLQSGYGASQAGLNTNLAQNLASNYGQQGAVQAAGTAGAANTMGNMYGQVGTQLGALAGNYFNQPTQRDATAIAMGASPGGAYTPTAGNSFTMPTPVGGATQLGGQYSADYMSA